MNRSMQSVLFVISAILLSSAPFATAQEKLQGERMLRAERLRAISRLQSARRSWEASCRLRQSTFMMSCMPAAWCWTTAARRLAFAICDNVGIPREVFDAARKIAAEETGIPPQNILMSATHTHSATTARQGNRLVAARGAHRLSAVPGPPHRRRPAPRDQQPGTGPHRLGQRQEPSAGLQSPLAHDAGAALEQSLRRDRSGADESAAGRQRPCSARRADRSRSRLPLGAIAATAGRSPCWPTTRCTMSAASAERQSRPITSPLSPIASSSSWGPIASNRRSSASCPTAPAAT